MVVCAIPRSIAALEFNVGESNGRLVA